jgi:hypothetical protein
MLMLPPEENNMPMIREETVYIYLGRTVLQCVIGVKTERIISDRPTDRKLTERKNGFGRIVAGYGHEYG